MEVVGGVLLPTVYAKLASALSKFFPYEKQLRRSKIALADIQDVLDEAAGKQITNEAVQLWLNDLEHLSYDLEDILNDLFSESMRRQLKKESYANSTTKKVLKTIPTYVDNTMYDRKMVSKLDAITVKLRHLYDEKSLLTSLMGNQRLTAGEISLKAEQEIVGREGDKEVLLQKLLGNQNVNVVAIVGMGGIGKTTMAMVLYNHHQVKDYFEPMAWISVGNEPDMFVVYQTIFQILYGNDQHFDDLDSLLSALREKLTAKRFLFVFDNVWNVHDDYMWQNLQQLFDVGEPGSKVIVTTRNTEITYVMSSVEVYSLKGLSNEAALSLFAQEALGDRQSFDSDPTLKLYAEGILRKCDGSPLALRRLGQHLRSRRDDQDWEELLNCEIRDLDVDIGILPNLKLSYYDLSAHMRRMFAYCSFFPRGYVFDKAELVLLWMAEGFLNESDDSKSMESLGDEYFEHLKSRAFFQHSTNEETRYTMHNLIHELAISIAQDFFFLLDDEKKDINGASKKFHHFSFLRQQFGVYLGLLQKQSGVNLELLRNSRRLRTFIAMPLRVEVDEGQRFYLSDRVLLRLLPELQFLRVLSLTGYSITEIPNSIGCLKNIRYLNFSQTDIRCLPEQVCELYQLQSLLLRDCKKLHSLPKSFVKLENLRHLDISNTSSLNKLPLGIGGLTNLQTLSKVIIDEANGFKISNLKGLLHLRGRLSIEGLQNVKNAKQAQEANLQQKNGLDDLVLEWSDVFDNSQKERTGYDILEMLRPHSGLKSLEILFYGGMEFPSWVGDRSFDQLTQLTLRGCESCTCLPTLGHLKSLQKLFVESMNKVKALDNEFLGTDDCPFASLEVLEFRNMEGWEKWSFENGENNRDASSFPCLREISLINCQKLVVVSNHSIPSLGFFRIEGCSKEVLRSIVRMCPSIVRLTMDSIEGLTQLNGEVLKQLGAVQYLCITKCHELRYLWGLESAECNILANLQNLEVRSCKKLESLGEKGVNSEISLESVTEVTLFKCEGLQSYNCPKSIERLVINKCHLITSLTFPTDASGLKILDIQECPKLEENWLSNKFLSHVESIEIHKWLNLKSFPVGCFVHMTKITKLIIRGCDNIESIPEKDFGILPLRYLEIISCKSMKSFPHVDLPRLTSLVELLITNCPSMDDSFPCRSWPPNLKSLRIGRLKKPMSKWGIQDFPNSLVNLCLLGENSGVVSFAKGNDATNSEIINSSSFLLPSSLTSLEIIGFRRLESLSEGLQHLTSLKQLVIESCSNVGDLPETLLPSLSSLKVSSSLKLQERCRDKSRNYQDLISHIPELDV